MADDYVMVCAVDFGTTFSGYAFSFRSSPEDIKMNKNWGNSLGFQSYKTATCVLTDGKGKFKDFGFDAEETYGRAVETSGAKDLSLYRHFKMILHQKGDVSRHSTVVSIDGEIRPAMEIFAHALKYLKDHMLDAVSKSAATKPQDSMIRWVLTVPAIWSDESKQFMREAAYKAGIIKTQDSRQLIIALEPEAASLFCRRLDIDHFIETGNSSGVAFKSGTKYIVIDAGGGTVDITAHQILASGGVKELHHATGGAWGGTRVDDNFIELLVGVLGANFVNRYKTECPQQWLVLMTGFEKVKKATKPDGKSTMNITLSWSLGSKYAEITRGQSIEQVIKKKGDAHGVSFVNGSLIISNKAVKKLFDPVTKEMVNHVEDLLSRPNMHPCKYFFLVGGFSESEFLQRAIIEHFVGRVTVLVPSEAQMSVIKGAVLFGHSPSEIKSRIAKRTYGCDCSTRFDASRHRESKKFIDEDGDERCSDIYKVFVQKGEEVDVGSTRKHTFSAATATQTSASFRFFAMDRKPNNPQYTTDAGVESVGTGIQIEMPDTSGGRNRVMEIAVTFGGTEIQIDGKDKTTGKTTKTSISFLTN